MQNIAAADRNNRRELPQDKAISRERERRIGQAQLRKARARRHHFPRAE